MYLAHYGLVEKPFQISPDPRFLWLGENHQEALATMKYAVLSNQGFLLLTGDVGTGKTTLINALVRSLGSDTLAATVFHPRLEAIEFMNTVARAFSHSDLNFTKRLDFITWFTGFLKNAHDGGLKVLLIIDEAQTLALELLEEIRLLSNIERPQSKLLNVFFVGQNEFNDILGSEQCKALRQRITNNYNIRPLSRDEKTKQYVHHRLRVAGAKREIFAAAAIKEVPSPTATLA